MTIMTKDIYIRTNLVRIWPPLALLLHVSAAVAPACLHI
jgi:hypothetical protein